MKDICFCLYFSLTIHLCWCTSNKHYFLFHFSSPQSVDSQSWCCWAPALLWKFQFLCLQYHPTVISLQAFFLKYPWYTWSLSSLEDHGGGVAYFLFTISSSTTLQQFDLIEMIFHTYSRNMCLWIVQLLEKDVVCTVHIIIQCSFCQC